MWPTDCPEWEYEHHPDRRRVLPAATAAVLAGLRTGTLGTRDLAVDTRVAHARLFSGLVPPEAPYYAGHYRGEEFRCLRDYPVGVHGDPRVGSHPRVVPLRMVDLAGQLDRVLRVLDGASLGESGVDSPTKLLTAVAVACRFFEALLRVHPYANGNGHMARLLVWAVLGRYGYWPTGLTVEPRTPDPRYVPSIVRYRDGDPVPLEQYVLQQIAGP